jgi:hypothetical protein
MTVRSTLRSPLWAAVLVLALACGGSSAPTDIPIEDVDDVELIESDVPDGTTVDVPVDGTVDRDDQAEEGVVVDVEVPDEGIPDGETIEPTDPGVEVLPSQCPCNETVVGAEVCLQGPLPGLARTEFKSDVCAKCALCAPGPNCVGCTGDKTDCVDLPEANYYTWRGECAVCPCDKTAECERLSFATCGPVCGDNAGVKTDFADVCAMKDALNCLFTYDTKIQNFGICPPPVCEACLGQPEDKVCGSDNKTYDNQCSLATCGAGATRACRGECLGQGFCPSCPTTCSPVCGEDNITYGNACAATTCGTGTKQIAYAGFCCPQCDSDPMVEVCGNDGNAYPNQCTALCHGASPCPTTGTAVCGNDGKTYANACQAACHGGVLHTGACTRICEQCPTTLSPVCAANTTYQNACFETCLAGTSIGTAGQCSFCTTQCGTIASPKAGTEDGVHCGADGITYPTSCFPTKCFGETSTVGACP